MPDLLANLWLGLGVAVTPSNLAFCFIGCLMGTLIGVLPGIGPLATVAMLLPVTFYLTPTAALIMLAGIYYGAQYGGSTTSILMNMPGETSSVVTCIDGFQMARQGRAGAALTVAALGSFFAGTVATFLIAAVATPLSAIGQAFSAADYCSLMVLGLVGVVILARGSVIKAIAMIIFGLLVGLVGTDVYSGQLRFTFGVQDLSDGIGIVPVCMGLFGLGEVMASLSHSSGGDRRSVIDGKISRLWLTRDEFRQSWPASLRGTTVGALLGILPGAGALLGSWVAYMVEKKIARDPSRFGRGAIEGVASPESANNAAAQTSFIPMLTFGIPVTPLMALLIGALMIQGITPGPRVMTQHADLFWGLIVSMWIGNAMLLIINLPLISLWVALLRVPYRLLFPGIMLFCAIGVYSVSNSTFEVMLAAGFGALAYFFMKTGCEMPPMILGLVLGQHLESQFRRAMLLSQGDLTVFVTRPFSLGFLVATAALLIIIVLPHMRQKREVIFQE